MTMSTAWSMPSRKSLAGPSPDLVMAPAARERDALHRRLFDLGLPVLRLTIRRALRRASVDEVPNLLNVIRGDMPLVGPRPDEPEIVAQYRPEYLERFRVKPGLTGLAQVNGRSDLTYEKIMAYDLAYAERASFV